MKDMVAKGRHNQAAKVAAWKNMLKTRRIPKGEEVHCAKLTDDQALLAKACPRKYGAASKFAAHFGVSLSLITSIRNGGRWGHIPEPTNEDFQRAEALFLTLKGN
jgi:hypothetical protein